MPGMIGVLIRGWGKGAKKSMVFLKEKEKPTATVMTGLANKLKIEFPFI